MKTYKITDLFATQWDELNQNQIITIIRLTDALTRAEKGSKQHGLLIIHLLRTLRKNKSAVGKMEVEQAVDCFNDLKFIKRNKSGAFISPWLFFPEKTFNKRGHRFSRPEMNGTLPMYNNTFSQLCFADAAFSAFCLFTHKLNKQSDLSVIDKSQFEKDTEECLNSLIAVLYCPAEEFDEKNIDARAKVAAINFPNHVKALILHTYSNVREFITSRERNLFPRQEKTGLDQEPVFTGEMWMNLRFDLAKTNVFTGFSAASNARIYDALDFLDKEVRESKERKPNGEE